MRSRVHKLAVRFRLALRQNRAALVFVIFWLLANAAVFARVFRHAPASAVLLAACVTKAHGGWPGIYQAFSDLAPA